jgi:hypothetical protein
MRSRSCTRFRLGANRAREVETPDACFRLHTRGAERESAGVHARASVRASGGDDVGSATASTSQAYRSFLGN